MLSSPKTKPSEDHLDRLFHALGDKTRRQLLSRLATGPARVTELAQPFDMSLPAVGKHLRVLESAGLIHRKVSGRVHECSLNALPLANAANWLEYYQNFWDQALDALGHHVEST